MIGQTYKSFNALLKSLEDKIEVEYVTLSNGRMYTGALLRLGNEYLNFVEYTNYRFDNRMKDDIIQKYEDNEIIEKINKLLLKYPYVVSIDNQSMSRQFHDSIPFIILPSTIETDIEKVVSDNKKQFAQVSKYDTLTSQAPIMKLSYALTNGNATYMTWLIKNYYLCPISIHTSERITNFIHRYPQLISQLEKKNVIAYNGMKEVGQLLREIHDLTCEKRMNRVINTFNTQQKRLLKALPKDKSLISSFSKFEQLSPTKQQNFIRKVSTMDDANEILKHLAFLTNQHFKWSRESVMEFVQNVNDINCDVVVDRDGIILFKVYDFETIKRLGKTTNWCISKNKSYWNNYITSSSDETSQYILMDFNKEEDDEYSIIGFTINVEEGIVAAHSFTNKNMMCNNSFDVAAEEFPVSIFNFIIPKNIELILNEYNIRLSDLHKTNEDCSWNEETFFSALSKCTNDEYYIMAQPEEGVFFLRIDNNDWKALFHHRFEYYHCCSEGSYILYLNFNANANDNERALCVGTRIDNNSREEEPLTAMLDFNGNMTAIRFDMLLKKYNMSYDTIKRVDTLVNRFVNCCANRDVDTLKELIKHHIQEFDELKVGDVMKLQRAFENLLQESLINYSPSVIELLSNPKPLCLTCSTETIRYLVDKIIRFSNNRPIKNVKAFSDKDIDRLKKHPKPIEFATLRNCDSNMDCVRFYLWALHKIVDSVNTTNILPCIINLLQTFSANYWMDVIITELLKGLGNHKVDNKSLQKIIPRLVGNYSYYQKTIETLLNMDNVEWDAETAKKLLSCTSSLAPYFEIIKNKCEAL